MTSKYLCGNCEFDAERQPKDDCLDSDHWSHHVKWYKSEISNQLIAAHSRAGKIEQHLLKELKKAYIIDDNLRNQLSSMVEPLDTNFPFKNLLLDWEYWMDARIDIKDDIK